jgi:ATP-dependent Lon protease
LRLVEQAPTEDAYRLRLARNTATEDQKRMSAMMGLLRNRGELRKLARIPIDWTCVVDDMKTRFPNFHAVLDYVSAAFALAERGNEVAHFDPILLNGSPGCGKSMFADALATEIRSGVFRLSMENAQSNASLSGSDEFWSNTKPGALFNILVEKDYANPVVFLDEIDKAKARDYDPMSSLLGLFEAGTARTFRDLSYPWITLDASRVIWICTSNNAESLSAPILDRVRRFDIPDFTDR